MARLGLRQDGVVEQQWTAYWTTGPRRGELRPEPAREPGAGEVLVRTLVSGISRGTESLVHRGAVPAEVADVMRAPFQVGDFPWPVKYGYLSVGIGRAGSDASYAADGCSACIPTRTATWSRPPQ